MSLTTAHGKFTCFAFSRSGRYIYVGDADGTPRTWDQENKNGDPASGWEQDNTGEITSVAALQNDFYLTACLDGKARRYDRDGEDIATFVAKTHALAARCIAVHPVTETLALVGDELTARIVNLNDIGKAQEWAAHRKGLRKVSWHPTEPLLATSGGDGEISLWDASSDLQNSAKPVATLSLIPIADDPSSLPYKYDCSAVWHPSGDCFFVAGRKGEVICVRRSGSEWKPDPTSYITRNRTGPVTALAVSPNGAYLATSHYGGTSTPCKVDIWNIASRKVIASHDTTTPGPVTQLAFSPAPDSNLLAWTTSHGIFSRLEDAVPSSLPGPVAPIPVAPPKSKADPATIDKMIDGVEDARDVLAEDEEGDEDDVDIHDVEDEVLLDDDDAHHERDYREMVNITKAQPAFQPGETPLSQTKRFLAINKLGYIENTIVPDTPHDLLEVKFFDQSKRHRIQIQDTDGFDLGYLGERCVVFARRHPPEVLFKSHLAGQAALDWTYTPSGRVVGIAAGALPTPGSLRNVRESDLDGFGDVVVATEDRALIFLSGTGRERRIMGLGGDVVTMVASHEWVFVVHRMGATTIDGFQNLSYSLINFSDFSVRQSGFLPMPKKATLKWVGITDEGAPAMFDSTGRIHVLTKYRIPHHASWARIMDTEKLERKQGKDESYWPIAIFGSTLLCFILKGQEPYPKHPLPPPQELPIELPFTSENKAEEKIERETILLEILRDGLDDELTSDEISKTEQGMDKDLVLLIQAACKLTQIPRAVELAKLIHNPRFLDSVVKIAEFYHFDALKDKVLALKGIREAEEDRLVLAREKRRQWTRQDPLPRPLFAAEQAYTAAAKPFQHFDAPPAISRPGLAPAIPAKETTRFPASSVSSFAVDNESTSFTTSDKKRKRDDADDFSSYSSSQDVSMPPPPKQRANPFARKNGTDNNRNPFPTKANRTIQKSDSFFDKVEVAEDAPKAKRTSKAKDKEKKEGPKQTTLFGMLSSSRVDKSRAAATAAVSVASTQSPVVDESESQDADMDGTGTSMSESAVESQESQYSEQWEETQPIDMEETQLVDPNS
uniref:Chromosome segregation protein n=1 Tax=Mycena chlorophos TaxID=658473 RepID=A0ABQ0L3N2_MYCCL|nr:chromosome segregation protein [Mycena chlorophos]